MKSKNIPIFVYIIFLVVFALGAGVLAYPVVSSWVNDKNQENTAAAYTEQIESLEQEDYSAYLDEAVEYNKVLLEHGTIVTDPFDFDAVNSVSVDYENTLDYSDVMATIQIPKIDVDLPIYHGTEEDTLAKGIGHLAGTSLPVGGAGTHCVLTGHTGLPGKTLFTNISKLEIGDVFYITVLNEKLVYQVDKIDTVLPDDMSLLVVDPDADWVTLVTCTPYGVNTHRLLVRGTRIYPEEMTQEEQDTLEQAEEEKSTMSDVEKIELIAAGIAVIMFIVMCSMMISSIREQRKRNKDEKE